MPTSHRRGDMFSKDDIKRLFGIPRAHRMTDEEQRAKGWFIYNTIIGCGWECKEWLLDFAPFQRRFMPKWNLLYKRHVESNAREWAVFEEDRLDFVDVRSQRTTCTFAYPNQYTSAAVAPRVVDGPPPPDERFAKAKQDVALVVSEVLPTEPTPRESLLKLFARWSESKTAVVQIKDVDLQVDGTDVSVSLHLQEGRLFAVASDSMVHEVEMVKTCPLSLLYRC